MYLSPEGIFGLRRSCTAVRRSEFWLSEGFVQTRHKATDGDYIQHLVHFLRRHCMQKVVLLGGSFTRVLISLLLKTAVSGAMPGLRAEDTHAAAPTAVGVIKEPQTWL